MKKRKYNTGRFVALPYIILSSHAWQSLSTDARCIFIELKRRYNGVNNGFLGLSCRDAAKVFHGSKDTARKRLQELVERGFVKMVNKGHPRNRHATEWLITTERDDRNGHHPTNDWKNYLK